MQHLETDGGWLHPPNVLKLSFCCFHYKQRYRRVTPWYRFELFLLHDDFLSRLASKLGLGYNGKSSLFKWILCYCKGSYSIAIMLNLSSAAVLKLSPNVLHRLNWQMGSELYNFSIDMRIRRLYGGITKLWLACIHWWPKKHETKWYLFCSQGLTVSSWLPNYIYQFIHSKSLSKYFRFDVKGHCDSISSYISQQRCFINQ